MTDKRNLLPKFNIQKDAQLAPLYASIIAAISTPDFEQQYRRWKAKEGRTDRNNGQ